MTNDVIKKANENVRKSWVEDDYEPRAGYAIVLDPKALGPVPDEALPWIRNKTFAPVRAGDLIRVLIIAGGPKE